MADQAEQLRERMLRSDLGADSGGPLQHKVITVTSGKGGVGKSNFCVNFALGLQQSHRNPLIIDADVGFADVEVLLGVRPRYSIFDVIEGMPIWEAISYSTSGLPFLSAGNGLSELHELSVPQVERLVDVMKQLEDRFDTILIDSGAGLGANMEMLMTAADDLIIVSTPEPTSIADAYSLLKVLVLKGELSPPQLVVNRARSLVDAKQAAAKLQMIAKRFLDVDVGILGYLLEDEAVVRSVMMQTPFVDAYPNSLAAKCVKQLVQNYLRVDETDQKRGIVAFLERLLRKKRAGGDVNSQHSAQV
jgi:flagellar biosynthesis protein FlhG